MKRKPKMTRKEKKSQFKNIDEWLIHKANLRRKNEEEDRKRAAEGMKKEFYAYGEPCYGGGSTSSVCNCNSS